MIEETGSEIRSTVGLLAELGNAPVTIVARDTAHLAEGPVRGYSTGDRALVLVPFLERSAPTLPLEFHSDGTVTKLEPK